MTILGVSLRHIDAVMDFIPIVSTVNNIVNIALTIIFKYTFVGQSIEAHRYYTHIKYKGEFFFVLIALSIPGLNIVVSIVIRLENSRNIHLQKLDAEKQNLHKFPGNKQERARYLAREFLLLEDKNDPLNRFIRDKCAPLKRGQDAFEMAIAAKDKILEEKATQKVIAFARRNKTSDFWWSGRRLPHPVESALFARLLIEEDWFFKLISKFTERSFLLQRYDDVMKTPLQNQIKALWTKYPLGSEKRSNLQEGLKHLFRESMSAKNCRVALCIADCFSDRDLFKTQLFRGSFLGSNIPDYTSIVGYALELTDEPLKDEILMKIVKNFAISEKFDALDAALSQIGRENSAHYLEKALEEIVALERYSTIEPFILRFFPDAEKRREKTAQNYHLIVKALLTTKSIQEVLAERSELREILCNRDEAVAEVRDRLVYVFAEHIARNNELRLEDIDQCFELLTRDFKFTVFLAIVCILDERGLHERALIFIGSIAQRLTHETNAIEWLQKRENAIREKMHGRSNEVEIDLR